MPSGPDRDRLPLDPAANGPAGAAGAGVVLAETTRGGIVESVHHGIVAVVDVEGRVVAALGDPERAVFFRSAAKPFQAIPLIESGAADAAGFTPAELALCCASHWGSAGHQAQVRAMLAKLDLGPEALRCGAPLPIDTAAAARVAAGLEPPTPLGCDCSGKHAGMLATCVHLGYPLGSYLDPDHPLQRTILARIAEVLDLPVETIGRGVDGCGVPTFAAPLSRFAAAFATLAAPERTTAGRRHAAALARLRAAMTAHPRNVGGEESLDSDLMALSGGQVVAKIGAEGLICFGFPAHGLGVAVRVLDGSFRALAAIVGAVLERLDVLDPATVAALRTRHPDALHNHAGRPVGAVRAAF